MKLALSVFKDGISTVFDAADQLLIMGTEGDGTSAKTPFKLSAPDPVRRAAELKTQGVDVLICGAISRPMEAAILSQGIEVHSFIRGKVDDVLDAYLNDRLGQTFFSLPGCHGRGRKTPACRSRARGAGPGRRRGLHCLLQMPQKRPLE